MYMTTILCDNCALIKRFFNRIQSSQLQFWIRYPSLLSGSAINWARLRFQKTNFDFRIITSRFSCVSFFISYNFQFLGFFFLPSIDHPPPFDLITCSGMPRHSGLCEIFACNTSLPCVDVMQYNKKKKGRFSSSHLPPNFNETWSPLIPEQEEMIDLLQTMIQFTSDHWVTLLIGFLIFLSYRYVTRLHCLHYVRSNRHTVKLHIIRWSNNFLSDIGTRK